MSQSPQIVVRLPQDVLDALKTAAEADSRSVSSAVLAAVRDWLNARERKSIRYRWLDEGQRSDTPS